MLQPVSYVLNSNFVKTNSKNDKQEFVKDIPNNSTVVNNPAYIVKKSTDKGKNFCAYGIENDDISIKPAEKKNKKAK